ncbi:hypothetical protein JHK87_028002 [Glycine soja]|nr:hypothetical protein JHK87_028002 [Glycine soja]
MSILHIILKFVTKHRPSLCFVVKLPILQVNLEYLGRVVFNINGVLYPDSVVGTDSHITMIDGLGVARWGVGGIEAEAAMLGQPMSMVLPGVVGFKLLCKLRDGVTATNLVLTVTQMLRKHGVVGKFVEFYESYLRANKMFVDYNEDFTVPKESQNKVAAFTFQGTPAHLRHGDVVIAAIITSCTNTSNPSVMLGVALVAKKACEFEGRIHPLTRSNYLSSPPLVVVYALAGTYSLFMILQQFLKSGICEYGTGQFTYQWLKSIANVFGETMSQRKYNG